MNAICQGPCRNPAQTAYACNLTRKEPDTMRTLIAHAAVAKAATRQKTDAGTAWPPRPGPTIRAGGEISAAACAGPTISPGDR